MRHILYSPKGDPSGAAQIPDTDPSWEAARAKALATYASLQGNPSLFDSIARKQSDEAQAQGPTGTGGKLPFFDSTSGVDPEFEKAILAPGLKDGQILPPVKSAFGWHVIQVMYHPTDEDHLKALKDQADKRRGLRRPRPRQLERSDGRLRRRSRLGRQGPAGR